MGRQRKARPLLFLGLMALGLALVVASVFLDRVAA
jgi:hypothetical protein